MGKLKKIAKAGQTFETWIYIVIYGPNPPHYLFKKFKGRPGRGHSIATSLPVDDRVM